MEDILRISQAVGIPAELIDTKPVTQPTGRKLATIQRVINKYPITLDGAPALMIEEIQVLGWWLVANIGQFNLNDLAVFFEIDTLFNPELAWVREYVPFMETKKWHVRTMQLKKFRAIHPDQEKIVVSQGLAIPVSVLQYVNPDFDLSTLVEGMDVTDMLGVTKYEPPFKFDMGESAGDFPNFIPKTDEKRVQGAVAVLDEIAGKPYYITMKYDGTSGTFWMEDGELKVASRNNRRRRGDNVYWNAAVKYGLEQKLQAYPHLALQGEIYGTSIQGNRLGEKELKLAIFNVFNRNTGSYLDYKPMVEILKELDIPMVHVLVAGDCFMWSLVELENMADDLTYPNGAPAEGIVIRSQKERLSEILEGRMSFKCISKNFLLKHGE